MHPVNYYSVKNSINQQIFNEEYANTLIIVTPITNSFFVADLLKASTEIISAPPKTKLLRN